MESNTTNQMGLQATGPHEHGLKNCFPFRLGTTSYIIPADIIPNADYLADKVDDIELVLFESDEISNLPNQCSIQKLREIADRNDLSYTVHLPLDMTLGNRDREERTSSVAKCLRVIRLLEPARPLAYIVHLHGEREGRNPAYDVERWKSNLCESVETILQSGVDPKRLCVETLSYPFELVDHIIDDFGLAICLDVGHLLLYGYPLEDYLRRYGGRTRVAHLHGVVDGEDHRAIATVNPEDLALLLKFLTHDTTLERVLTLEIFSEADLLRSFETLQGFL